MVASNSQGGEHKTSSTDKIQPQIHTTSRRQFFVAASTAPIAALAIPELVSANDSKSRTKGYKFQHDDDEWRYLLSDSQYRVLRNGATERPHASVLEKEDEEGTYFCAGCDSPLFASTTKFESNTGYPTFASSLRGVEIQIEDLKNPMVGTVGAELRCRNCGGHIGDVFFDGTDFADTPAFTTGKRYRADGAALIFRPPDNSEEIFGNFPQML